MGYHVVVFAGGFKCVEKRSPLSLVLLVHRGLPLNEMVDGLYETLFTRDHQRRLILSWLSHINYSPCT